MACKTPPTNPRRALNDLLKFTNDNLGTAKIFQKLFQATLEYLQFLVNNRSQAIGIHATTRRIQQEREDSTVAHHAQYKCLCQFHELYCQLAEAIERDFSGEWGDISPTIFSKEYQERKLNFEVKMDKEWREAQTRLNQNDIQCYWTLC